MGVVAEMCDEVAVMYAGRIVEEAPIGDVFKRSRHPYTKGLLRSLPQKSRAKKADLPTIEGVVPSLLEAAALLPLRRTLLEAQEPARRRAEEVLHRRPAAAAVQETASSPAITRLRTPSSERERLLLFSSSRD